MKTIVAISDLQVPYHDRKAVDAVSEFIRDYKPEMVLTVGDEADLPQLSRWTRGTEGEFTRRLDRDREMTFEVLKQLQVSHMTRSNHMDRLWTSISTRLPGLLGLPELSIERFFRLDELGITFHHTPWDPTGTGKWLLMHGDEAGSSQVAGQTSANLVKKTGRSVLCGHSHRAGIIPFSTAFGHDPRNVETKWGLECGNLMDIRHAKYVKTPNWQQAFGLLHVEGKTVIPQLIPILNRSFIVDGVRYAW